MQDERPVTGFVQAMSTTDSRAEADRLARGLVEARLAACVQVVGPIASTYRWQGQVETGDEWLLLVKTTAQRAEELVAYLAAHHSYDTPEVIVTPIVAGNPAYLDWLTA